MENINNNLYAMSDDAILQLIGNTIRRWRRNAYLFYQSNAQFESARNFGKLEDKIRNEPFTISKNESAEATKSI